jgi:hypothetical protein
MPIAVVPSARIVVAPSAPVVVVSRAAGSLSRYQHKQADPRATTGAIDFRCARPK